ncbi:hypothetical protein DFH11DRAFT_1822643 [Phellopilus nigrolimitatus]|nr:hypothetical protein DFH11DRAFT_1822643 [Phellopilus nigrolimitatus]
MFALLFTLLSNIPEGDTFLPKAFFALLSMNHRNKAILSGTLLFRTVFQHYLKSAQPSRSILQKLLKKLLDVGAHVPDVRFLFQCAVRDDATLNTDAIEIIRSAMKAKWPMHFSLENSTAFEVKEEGVRWLPSAGFTFMMWMPRRAPLVDLVVHVPRVRLAPLALRALLGRLVRGQCDRHCGCVVNVEGAAHGRWSPGEEEITVQKLWKKHASSGLPCHVRYSHLALVLVSSCPCRQRASHGAILYFTSTVGRPACRVMATPSSSGTSPSSAISFTVPAVSEKSTNESNGQDASPSAKNAAGRFLLTLNHARTTFDAVARVLQVDVPLRNLEMQVAQQVRAPNQQAVVPSPSHIITFGGDKKLKAGNPLNNTAYYNGPVAQSHNMGGIGVGGNAYSSSMGMPSPKANYTYPSTSSGPSLVNTVKSLFALPPAKRARTIHNPEEAPVLPPPPPSQGRHGNQRLSKKSSKKERRPLLRVKEGPLIKDETFRNATRKTQRAEAVPIRLV